jgi:vitamin B12 transporter
MNKIFNITLGLSLVPFFADASIGNEDTAEIETIIVTENRIPTIVSESLSSVSILEREDIEKYQATDLYDLMSRVPGIRMSRNGGRGAVTSLSLRGNQSDHTLILVDGVRIGSATLGGATLGLLSTNLIDRIEIVRGPKSYLYGANAIGGVVNIITRRLDSSKSPQLKLTRGGNNTSETSVSFGSEINQHSFSMVLNSFETDGIDNTENKSGVNGDQDSHSNDGLALNYQNKISDQAKVSMFYMQNDTETDYDSNCSRGEWPNSTLVECEIFSVAEISSWSALLELGNGDNWVSSLQIGKSTDNAEEFARNVDITTTNNAGSFNTTKTEVTWFNTLSFNSGDNLSIGLDYINDEVDSSTTDYVKLERDNKAAFLQYQFKLVDTEISLGARKDDNEHFGGYTTTSFMMGEDVTDNVRLNLSFGEAFKAPTFNDLYWPKWGNPNLVPETSANLELSMLGNWDNMQIGAAVFQNKLKNLISNQSSSTGQTPEAIISGLEVNLNTDIAGWTIDMSASFLEPTNKTNNKLLRRRPEISGTLNADYVLGDAAVGFSVYSQSHAYDDVSNKNKLGGFTTLSFRASFNINNEMSLRFNVNNLTDEEYTTARDFSLGEYQSIGREAMVTFVYTPNN